MSRFCGSCCSEKGVREDVKDVRENVQTDSFGRERSTPRGLPHIEPSIPQIINISSPGNIIFDPHPVPSCVDASSSSSSFPIVSDGTKKIAKNEQITTDLDISVPAVNAESYKPRRYPEYAVGIEQSVKEVIDLLELENENNAVAVILHGSQGMGKTTLADAVFSGINIKEYKYSMVEVLENIDSTPKIVKLQKLILKDIMDPKEPIPDIRKYEDGQQELSLMLEKVPAFIYIDNVLCHEELQYVLPRSMKNTMKVRLLLTTRDINVRRACKMKTKVYDMKSLPDKEAMHLLEKEMYDGTHKEENQLSSIQLNRLMEKCGGVPQLLTIVAGIIRCAEDKQNAYSEVMKEKLEVMKGKLEEHPHIL